jgi:2-dehydro-3-deoxyphosphogluconate aldolase/(4S)-4-hydroxy-2-oxoglutarate aldolase
MDGSPALARIRDRGLLAAVTTVRTEAQAVGLARAFVAAGLEVMEITLRHPSAPAAIAAVRAEVPAMCCGAGTVLNEADVEAARAAGAGFVVTPGFHARTVDAALAAGLPIVPGVATPGEIEQALARGCRLCKLFPAEALGGLDFVRAVAGPYAHTGLGLIPMGGVGPTNAAAYAALPICAAVGGSWVAPAGPIADGDWAAVEALVRQALAGIAAARPGPQRG